MEQIKIFSGTYIAELENKINGWLLQNKNEIKITRVCQDYHINNIIISIFYRYKSTVF